MTVKGAAKIGGQANASYQTVIDGKSYREELSR